MRKSARTQIPPFFDNDPYRESCEREVERTDITRRKELAKSNDMCLPHSTREKDMDHYKTVLDCAWLCSLFGYSQF